MNFLFTAVITLGVIALISAVILYVVSSKFSVEEDSRIGQVQNVLPGANCGGCGFAGCAGMATALVKGVDVGHIEGLYCPVGGTSVMEQVAGLLGITIAAGPQKVAVVRCNGTCENRPHIADYDGLHTCTAMNATGSGETACGYGCLGCGDCVSACQFGAIRMNHDIGLPEVDEDVCMGCGACVKSCPRHIIELRKKGPKGRRVFVSCVNKEKAGVARKACQVACVGCGKCQNECKFGAISVLDNLSYIDDEKCKLCTKCVEACPTHAIVKVNFPAKKPFVVKSEIMKEENE